MQWLGYHGMTLYLVTAKRDCDGGNVLVLCSRRQSSNIACELQYNLHTGYYNGAALS